MKTFLLAAILPLLLIQEEQLSVNGECQLMVNDCTLSPGKLPLGGFPSGLGELTAQPDLNCLP